MNFCLENIFKESIYWRIGTLSQTWIAQYVIKQCTGKESILLIINITLNNKENKCICFTFSLMYHICTKFVCKKHTASSQAFIFLLVPYISL